MELQGDLLVTRVGHICARFIRDYSTYLEFVVEFCLYLSTNEAMLSMTPELFPSCLASL